MRPPAGFEPTIPASERLQTYASDHAASVPTTLYPVNKQQTTVPISTVISTYNLNPGSVPIYIYKVSQEERTKLREGVPYVKLYRYNPKHLYPKLNGYGDNGKRSLKL